MNAAAGSHSAMSRAAYYADLPTMPALTLIVVGGASFNFCSLTS